MWEKRYNTDAYIFGKAPARFIAEHSDYLTAGQSALVIADGEGRNSVFIAQQGMQVTAQEFAPSAISKAKALATEAGQDITFEQSDIFARHWEVDTYDLVAGIFIQFTGPDGRRKIFDGIKQATKPGGLVMLHGYSPKQLEYGTGGPPFAENMYSEVILRAAFVGWEILQCREYDRDVQEGSAHVGMSALVDLVARKPI